MKSIVIFSQHYYPEQFRINDLAEELVNRGHIVTVVTGIPNFPEGKFFSGYSWFKKRYEVINGVNVIRLPITPRGKGFIMLPLNYLSYIVCGCIWSWFTREKYDIVFTYAQTPIMQAIPANAYARRFKVPSILYVLDLWPESVEAVIGIKNKAILNSVGKMVDWIYKRSTKILSSSQSNVQEINKRGVDMSKLIYWPQYAEDFYEPIKDSLEKTEIIHDSKVNITYAGNIGPGLGLDLLPQVASSLISQGITNFRFNIIGDGLSKESLVKTVKDEALDQYFQFIDRKPASEIPEYLADSDFAFIPLASHPLFDMAIPAKVQSILACGKPILASANGEVANIVENANCGYVSNAGDVDGLVNNIKIILSLEKDKIIQLGQNALKYSDNNFSKEKLIDELELLVEEL